MAVPANIHRSLAVVHGPGRKYAASDLFWQRRRSELDAIQAQEHDRSSKAKRLLKENASAALKAVASQVRLRQRPGLLAVESTRLILGYCRFDVGPLHAWRPPMPSYSVDAHLGHILNMYSCPRYSKKPD